MRITSFAVAVAAILPAAAYAQLGDDSAYGRAGMMTVAASPSAAGTSAGQGTASEVSTDHGMRWSTSLDEPGWSRGEGAPASQPGFAADGSTPLGDLYLANGL